MKYSLLVLFLNFSVFADDLVVKRTELSNQYPKENKVELLVDGKKIEAHYQYRFYRAYDQENFYFIKNQIGEVFPPYSTVNYSISDQKRKIYDVSYQIGEYGQRVYADSKKSYKKHLIVSGDSNSFGEGCQDNETLDYFLSQNLKDFHRYNFSHRGGGPNNTLAFFESFPLEKLVKEKNGVMIYNFYVNFLFQRTIGSKESIKWNVNSPFYFLNEQGDVKRNGSFKNRPLTYLYKFLNAIPFFDFLVPELPRIHDHHVFFVAKLLESIQKRYLEKFPEGKFIVMINNFPNEEFLENSKLLKKYLDELQVESEEIYLLKPKDLQYVDLHLNPEGHKTEAIEIAKVLKYKKIIEQ